VQLHFKYESVVKCRRKLKTTVLLLDKKPDRKQTVLTEEKLDDTGARLETYQENLLNV
jgi:hypothetical protein